MARILALIFHRRGLFCEDGEQEHPLRGVGDLANVSVWNWAQDRERQQKVSGAC